MTLFRSFSKKGIKEKFIWFFSFSSHLLLVLFTATGFILLPPHSPSLRWVEIRHNQANNLSPLGNPKLHNGDAMIHVLHPHFISSVFNFAIWFPVRTARQHSLCALSLVNIFFFLSTLCLVIIFIDILLKYNKAKKVLIRSLRSRGHFDPGVVPSAVQLWPADWKNLENWMLHCFLSGVPSLFCFIFWVGE